MLSDVEIVHRALITLRAAHERHGDDAATRRRAEAVLVGLHQLDLVKVTAVLALLAVTPRPAALAEDQVAIGRWLDLMTANLALHPEQ